MSRLLVDTHIALWFVTDTSKMPAGAWQYLNDSANLAFVSVVSIWECAIKYRLNRDAPGDMPLSGSQALLEFGAAGFEILSVEPQHATAVDQLPIHHRDPFDRLLIAQAITEPLIFLTHDSALAVYGDHVIVI